ncbi:ROK family transcriptional regulator [Trebonia kvetii]|uniref:ROK family transcriptional regulator n=1 Tax=Trebonia kvetii TaxID=2480626 RepID=A0A6P2BTR7_9ACTN|nr:ROK family transcriptional regulator [Trebonia kvetii]
MLRRRRGTMLDLRRENRAAVLWSLYFSRPGSRQDLSAATGLSTTSVTNVVRELIDDGIVIEVGSEGSDGGRPRMLLDINPNHRYAIGVDVGETRIRVELFDLAMTPRAKAEYPLNPAEHDVDTVVQGIVSGLNAVLTDGGVDPAAVLGVGVGVPGLVEQGPEVLVHGQTYGWDAVPLERLVRVHTGLPLRFENCAKNMGQAELWFGAARGAENAVVVLVGSGVGASLISGGTTCQEATSSATEWGHTTIVAGGRRCRCGSFGCLEAYVGAEAILDRCGNSRRVHWQHRRHASAVSHPAGTRDVHRGWCHARPVVTGRHAIGGRGRDGLLPGHRDQELPEGVRLPRPRCDRAGRPPADAGLVPAARSDAGRHGRAGDPVFHRGGPVRGGDDPLPGQVRPVSRAPADGQDEAHLGHQLRRPDMRSLVSAGAVWPLPNVPAGPTDQAGLRNSADQEFRNRR